MQTIVFHSHHVWFWCGMRWGGGDVLFALFRIVATQALDVLARRMHEMLVRRSGNASRAEQTRATSKCERLDTTATHDRDEENQQQQHQQHRTEPHQHGRRRHVLVLVPCADGCTMNVFRNALNVHARSVPPRFRNRITFDHVVAVCVIGRGNATHGKKHQCFLFTPMAIVGKRVPTTLNNKFFNCFIM